MLRFVTAVVFLIAALCGTAAAQVSAEQKAANLASFELVWSTVRDHHPDPKLNGLDWQAVHDATRFEVEQAQSASDVRQILSGMLAKLGSSHYSIIPAGAYAPTSDAPPPRPSDATVAPGDDKVKETPALVDRGKTSGGFSTTPAPPPAEDAVVQFGNLPALHVRFESRVLTEGIGYISLNEFLDPVSIMPRFGSALKNFASAPGVILDLRGNPGGIGVMAMGIAGFFISDSGKQLGEMKSRSSNLKFVIFPRPDVYAGPLAILVDGGSASTSEILAQGLQDLGRARIFGERSAGAALPSDIIRLPNGDGFQYAEASYVSVGGKTIEGNGVIPDVAVNATAGSGDPVIEAAAAWIRSLQK